LRNLKDALLIFFELVTYGGGALLLPGALADLLFGWGSYNILVPVLLVGVPCTLILTGVALHEGWYYDHLSGWGFDSERVEPTLPPPAVGALKRHKAAVDDATRPSQKRERRPSSGDRIAASGRRGGGHSKISKTLKGLGLRRASSSR